MKKAYMGILAAVAGIAITALLTSGIMASAASLVFEANDVTISSDDGRIEYATISPRGTFSWQGVDVDVNFDGDDRIVYEIYVSLNGGEWGLLWSGIQTNWQNIEDMGTTGFDKFTMGPIELRKPGVIAYWQMEADEDGSTKVSKIRVKLVATLQTSDVVDGVTKWRDLVSASNTATFTLTCTNEKAIGSIGGNVNVAAKATDDT